MLIYFLWCKASEKGYVGQTIQPFARRWSQHQRVPPTRSVLAKALHKYGPSGFDLIILEKVNSRQELDEREVHWIQELDTIAPRGYNLKLGGQGGGLATDVSRQNMRQAQLGKKQPPEQVEKRAAKLRGKKRPPELVQKLVDAWKDRPRIFSDEHKRKLSVSHLGVELSHDTKSKMSETQRKRREVEKSAGIKPQFSVEGRESLRAFHLGRKLSEETKQRMRESHRKRLAKLKGSDEVQS